MKRSDGLFPMQKMALQIVVTAVFAFYIIRFTDVSLALLLPFTGGRYWNIGWLAIPLMFVAVIGVVNGVNFTDWMANTGDEMIGTKYFHVPPGETKVQFYYSSFCNPAPVVTARIKEAFL